MEKYSQKTNKEIKNWLATNKVCIVTNSEMMPGSLYVATLKTYIDYVPIHNLWLIPGDKNGEPFYGLTMFTYMLNYMLVMKKFDYVIYIDEDCFITDFNALLYEFQKFINSGCCIAGPQDGGVFCHRNHSKVMINTFLSFWNIKMLIDANISFNDIFKYIETHPNNKDTFKDWQAEMVINHKGLYGEMNYNADKSIKNVAQYRFQRFPNGSETDYAQVVKDDSTNSIEPHQTPYTYKDDIETFNFEPYYLLEQALVSLTGSGIYYMFATDFYDDTYKDKNIDMSGLTSAVYCKNPDNEFNDHKLIAVHSWFSRAYTKWPTNKIQLEHTKRINTLIKTFSKI